MYKFLILTILLAFSQAGGGSSDAAREIAGGHAALGSQTWWDDGLSEMSYYDATETVYGKERKFTRVHLVNRQWMDTATGVKANGNAEGSVAVLKFNISEEIPTENYNYRYLTTVFVKRFSLEPFKMVASSQEWCGATFKHLRWTDASITFKSFSYFGDEGDQAWILNSAAVPYESLPLQARSVVASGKDRSLELLMPVRSTHEVKPVTKAASLRLDSKATTLKTPAGSFKVRRVRVEGAGEPAWFDVENETPYRLIAFSAGGVDAVLRRTEKRPYWNRDNPSTFHASGEAP
ncbi:MAG: hypothetical protein GXP29_06105 [Planctomycetes bacterium]|nr:hypothetical protein [Planctomycetota bacterium]